MPGSAQIKEKEKEANDTEKGPQGGFSTRRGAHFQKDCTKGEKVKGKVLKQDALGAGEHTTKANALKEKVKQD